MSNDINQSLSEVYDLIEANDLNEAERLLKPILSEHPDNADAWWLYAHAVQDPEAARMALNTVLKIDEDYPEAKSLLQTLDEKYPEAVFVPPSLPDLPESTVTDDDFDEDLDDEDFEEEPEPSGRSGLLLMLLALLAIAVVVIGVILNPLANDSESDPTAVAQVNEATEQAQVGGDSLVDDTQLTSTAMIDDGTGVADGVLTQTSNVADGGDIESTDIAPVVIDETDETGIGDVISDAQLTSTAIIQEGTAIASGFATEESTTETTDEGDEGSEDVTSEDVSEAQLTSTAIVEEGTAIASGAPTAEASLGVLPSEGEGDTGSESPNVIGSLPTDSQTDETEGEIITEETTETNLSALMNALDEFQLHDEGIGVADTEMGKTLLAAVCSGPSLAERVETSNAAMVAVANAGTLVDEDIDATGIKLINCESDQTLNVIGVDVNTAIEFSAGTIDIKQYEASWQPVL